MPGYSGKIRLVTTMILLIGVKLARTQEAVDATFISEEELWPNIRLPDNLIPVEYDVDIRPILEEDADGNLRFEGTSTVTYRCEKPTDLVVVHSSQLKYGRDQVAIKNEEEENVEITKMTFDGQKEFVIFSTAHPCLEGALYRLTVSNFKSIMAADLTGLYRGEYNSKTRGKINMATSLMAATEARETFPCFDEPAFKANFTITLWYKANTGYYAISNMPPASYHAKMIVGEMWNSTTFQETAPISTYLLALVVCDFSYEETFSKSNIQTRIYARNETIQNNEAIYASEITPRILEFYEEYFSIDYPLPKCDQLALPDFAAVAMENWGLVIYSEDNLLYKKSSSSIFNKLRVTQVVAHELAHQWFGNLVSPAWWDDVWLNEGFATFVSYLGVARVQPAWKVSQMFLPNELHPALRVDALASSRSLIQSVETTNEIVSLFDTITYSKGASILRMANGFIGEEYFVAGLTNYLSSLAYSTATHEDLFHNWEMQVTEHNLQFPATLSAIIKTWTLQKGYPVIQVERSNSIISITQERFLLKSPLTTDTSYKWYVPFSYKTPNQIGTEEKNMVWLEPNDTSPVIVHNAEYILGNIDAVGFYRVNYDSETWFLLSEILRSTRFTDLSIENRAQLLEDAFTFSSSGHLDIATAMELSRYLHQEREYVPWKTFLNKLTYVDHMLGRSVSYGDLSNYIVSIVSSSLYNSESWKEKDKRDEALTGRLTKQLGIEAACKYGHAECVLRASRLFKRWMAKPSNTRIISNTFRNIIYCTAIRHGGVAEWDFAWRMHNMTDNAQLKASLRYGLSCSREPWILARYLTYCVNPSLVREADGVTTCLQYIADSEYGRDIMWSTVVQYWDMLMERYGSGNPFFVNVIAIMTSRFSTSYDLKQLEDFKASHPKLGNSVRAFDQAIENTKINMRWRQLNENMIASWLRSYNENRPNL